MLFHELTLRGILSFGPGSPTLPLQQLNVLIGPNGSGKSNLLEVIDLLRSSATKLTAPLRGSGAGGVTEWIWKGAPAGTAYIDAVVDNPSGNQSLRHSIEFAESSARFELVDESIENAQPYEGFDRPYFFYQFQRGRPVLLVRGADGDQPRQENIALEGSGRDAKPRRLQREDVALDESILSQRKDPDLYPELAYLSRVYGQVRIYREWSFGRLSAFRRPQPADLPGDRLEEDFSNLGLFLNHLRSVPAAKNRIVERLRDLYEGVRDFDVRIKGGTVEVFLTEQDFIVPASRLSDGTLRYLCLLAILCDPDPPALVCIEEPELGLHPDVLPKLAELMVAASTGMQLIVTTHSDILVDAMTEHPQAIVVVEKHEGQTHAARLKDDAELHEWLRKYRLGQLWIRGEIGGTRW